MTDTCKKFISPNAWFSMLYPSSWSEFEDAESVFLFYNPDKWTGNFRISAYKNEKGIQRNWYGEEFLKEELQTNPSASLVSVGSLKCAYSKEMFQEGEQYYVTHVWITGIESVAFECSFTVPKGGEIAEAEEVIASLEIRKEGKKYPAELIPVRVLEVSEINESYEKVASEVKKQLKKDFSGVEKDLNAIQQLIDSGNITAKQKEMWVAFGIATCVILVNEVDGLEWMTLIDGNREAPVLKYAQSDTVIDPMSLYWSKVKRTQPVNALDTYKQIIESL